MTLRKIDLMHKLYGHGNGQCTDCNHFLECKANKTYFKCELYGNTNSEASDWRKKYDACGMKNVAVDMKKRNIVIGLIRNASIKKIDFQCEGQETLFSEAKESEE